MILYKLNNGQANAVKGPYKKQHDCIPGFIEDKFHILHLGIENEPELDMKVNFNAIDIFTIGDGSADDLIYQDWLLIKQNA